MPANDRQPLVHSYTFLLQSTRLSAPIHITGLPAFCPHQQLHQHSNLPLYGDKNRGKGQTCTALLLLVKVSFKYKPNSNFELLPGQRAMDKWTGELGKQAHHEEGVDGARVTIVPSVCRPVVGLVVRSLMMPSKKKKYNARFPPARIKKIMQADEEVGKVAAVVPVIICEYDLSLISSHLTSLSQQQLELWKFSSNLCSKRPVR